MKRLLFLLALVVGLQLNASAQLKFAIDLPDTLVGKRMLENAIKQAFKDYGKPTDPVVVKPVEKVKCSDIGQGPDIKAVTGVSASGLDLKFHGNGIDTILVDILSPAGQLIKSQVIAPRSSTVSVPFGQLLPAGNYQLRLQGQSCKSDAQNQSFTVPNSETGGGTKPAPEPGTETPGQGSGNGSANPAAVLPLVNLTQGMDDHLNLTFRDSADVRIMSDIAPDNRGDKGKFLYRYLINGHQIDTDARLKNYVVAGNNPLRVLVGKLNRQYKSEGFNKWAGTPQEAAGGWYKTDAAEPFSFNTSYAFQTFVAPAAQAATGFLNHVPQNYDPSSQQVSWGTIGEDIQLPKGHFWGASWYPWGVEKVFAKGVTHLAHHSLPWDAATNDQLAKDLKAAGKTFSDYQRIEAVFGRTNSGSPELWPNGTSKAIWPTADGLPADEAREWAWKTGGASDAIWLSEMSENVGWQPGGSPMFSAFYPELRKRYEQNFGSKGIPYEIIHNYFWQGGESLNSGRSADYYKELFRKDPQDLPRTEFSPGAPLSATTMIVEAVYLPAPDLAMRQPTELAFRLEYFKQMGYHAGVVLFGQGETRPNNRYKINFPDGTYYKSDKFPLDPNVHIASLFFGHVYGNATFEWGGYGWANQKLFDGRPGQPLSGDWFPTGSTEPRNNEFNKLWNGSGDFYHGFTGSADLTYFAHRLYAKTFGVTDGGDRQYLTYRIDGGAWITPSQYKADELVDAYKQQRGFALAQSRDGKTAWFYHNSFADNVWHTLEVKLPSGQVITERVAGNGIHAKIQ
ncbi:hypothetical protein [Dyadobacter sp. OTU695]|uniref:hypothetical protein n=1 Tax=Dyadobacter sp. OTU695 TaxID=3043860 RepID=UPI00313ADB6E